MEKSQLKLSIIIPTCNRGKNLVQVLDSVVRLQLDYQFFELLLIDNASTDNTKAICENFIQNHPEIISNYYYEPEPGLLSGRHLGAFKAQGEILSFLDDDVELIPTWANSVIEIFEKKQDIDLLAGPNLPKYECYPPDWLEYFWTPTPYKGRSCGELSLLDLGKQITEIDAIWVWGLNFNIRKSAFYKLKGFHPDIVPGRIQFLQGDGETGLSIKANEAKLKSLYHYEVMVYHIVPAFRLTKEYFEKRYYYQGISDSYTKLRTEHGLYLATESDNQSTARKSIAKGIIKKILSIFTSKYSVKIKPVPDNVLALKADLQIKYQEGYAYHQQYFNSNQIVHDWVLRTDYMDYKIPEI